MKKTLLLMGMAALLLVGSGCSNPLSRLMTKAEPDPTHGHLIKGASYTTVYFLGADGKRYVFPTDKTYLTWFKSFSIVKKVSDQELMSTPLGGNVTYRPASRLIKIETDPKVYAVTRGGVLRWVTTESLAQEIFGTDWKIKVDDVPDAFFTNYKYGQPITTLNDFSPENEEKNTTSIDQDKGLVTSTQMLAP